MDPYAHVPPSETPSEAEDLPTMADLDRLESDLDAIDRALAEIDQTDDLSRTT